MARYYDLDKLSEMIQEKADTLIEGKEAFLYVAKWLDLLPPADVVPKSEVENYKQVAETQQKLSMDRYFEIKELKGDNERLKNDNEYLQDKVFNVRLEVAMEIFEEIEKVINEKYNRFVFKDEPYDSDEEINAIINYSDSVSDGIAQLKKKYTEDKK